jgi:hypothetical protein
MFVSTREMLGQTSPGRALAEAVIREHYGPECNIEVVLRELSVVSLRNLGFNAFSDEALQEMASFLQKQNHRTVSR